MSKSIGLLERASKLLSGVGLKAPWKVTGPVSSPEYMTHLPKAVDYRSHAPASAPGEAIVPHAENDLIYNIKYYTRDTRKKMMTGNNNKLVKLSVDEIPETGKYVKAEKIWKPSKRRSILDVDNNGYTL